MNKTKVFFIALIILCFSNSVLAKKHAVDSRKYLSNYIYSTIGDAPYYLHDIAMYLFPAQCPNYRALSVGSSSGNEEIDLIKREWNVTGVDINPISGEIIAERAKFLYGRFSFQNVSLSKIKLTGTYDYFISLFVFPFEDKKEVLKLIRHMSLYSKKGTIVAVNFFGPEHDYVRKGSAFAMSEKEVKKALEGNRFEILQFLHRVYDKPNTDGIMTHKDIFDVIARKK